MEQSETEREKTSGENEWKKTRNVVVRERLELNVLPAHLIPEQSH